MGKHICHLNFPSSLHGARVYKFMERETKIGKHIWHLNLPSSVRPSAVGAVADLSSDNMPRIQGPHAADWGARKWKCEYEFPTIYDFLQSYSFLEILPFICIP
jgi:hypothetical protein